MPQHNSQYAQIIKMERVLDEEESPRYSTNIYKWQYTAQTDDGQQMLVKPENGWPLHPDDQGMIEWHDDAQRAYSEESMQIGGEWQRLTVVRPVGGWVFVVFERAPWPSFGSYDWHDDPDLPLPTSLGGPHVAFHSAVDAYMEHHRVSQKETFERIASITGNSVHTLGARYRDKGRGVWFVGGGWFGPNS